ncbi:hypothetical protein EJ08DRAFT_680835 [Tothia fuscella]|uniref:Ribosome assembly protein 3 n=1 Tax=Tothia fuscella TaxID=1048955 RepID=A0A9P4NN20_9PEZI|nr:hypothetical protein EJ08DRAFT_680835 [Tothia fuscella]
MPTGRTKTPQSGAPAKRRRKRNTRTTEVSSESSSVSDTSSESSTSDAESEDDKHVRKRARILEKAEETRPQLEPIQASTSSSEKSRSLGKGTPSSSEEDGESEEDAGSAVDIQEAQKESANQDFTSWYLRKITQELEDDLDKIRSAGDFNENSLPVLINALQQGETIFSAEEKRRIVGKA